MIEVKVKKNNVITIFYSKQEALGWIKSTL